MKAHKRKKYNQFSSSGLTAEAAMLRPMQTSMLITAVESKGAVGATKQVVGFEISLTVFDGASKEESGIGSHFGGSFDRHISAQLQHAFDEISLTKK